MSEAIKSVLMAKMKEAMKAGEKEKLATIRLIQAELKRVEVDERIDLAEDNTRALAILDKMLKQRRDSIEQFEKADREDLAEKERFEMGIIQDFMPAQMSESEIVEAIDSAMAQTGASSIKDMGKVMAELKPKLQGRADMGAVSTLIKQRLN